MSREEMIQELIHDLNEEIASLENSALSFEGSHAEFCASFGYGEGEPDFSRVDIEFADEISDLVARIKDIDGKNYLRHLGDACDLDLVDIYVRDDEIFSVHVGEVEQELSPEITARLDALTEEEQKAVYRKADHFMNDNSYVYINCDYSRFIMVLNIEKLRLVVRRLKRKNKKKGA